MMWQGAQFCLIGKPDRLIWLNSCQINICTVEFYILLTVHHVMILGK